MLEVFQYYAKSNKQINQSMIDILDKQKEDIYSKQLNGYFKNVGEILDHVYKVDILWLSAFKCIRDFKILDDSIFSNLPNYTDRAFNNFNDFKIGRLKVDSLFVSFVEEIKTDDLSKTVSRVIRSGEKFEKLFWKSLIHVFNHQTHHRGQISQVLDELKIDNDYSNMIRID